MWGLSLFWLSALLSMSFFVALFVYYFSQVTYLMNGSNKDTYCYEWCSVWCWKYENILQFNIILPNWFLATAVAQFTTKTTNSERAIKFLSLESPIKSHMLFTNKKNLCFPILCRRKWWWWWGTSSMLSIQYLYKILRKMDKNILRYSMLFYSGPTSPKPPQTALRFPKTPSPGMVNHILSTSVLLLNNLHFSLYTLNERVFWNKFCCY